MLTSSEIRSRFLAFFKERGHTIIPSASLVPEGDATTLFTGSGMQPLVPYLLGKNHPAGVRLANSQKCFRAMDIEEVGDNRHTTFFEMLGNWSFGDYFKKEQLPWFFEFLTKELGIPKGRLWVTCFAGDEKLGLPKDEESAKAWAEIGIPPERIRFYDAKKNWWSRSGPPEKMPAGEPGGPDSEMFYEFTNVPHNVTFGAECHPNCDCGRFMEIGNSVFMEYIKNADGTFGKLPKRNVDFGGGLERIAAAVEDKADVFGIDLFAKMVSALETLSGASYADEEKRASFRIVADHLRAAIFLIADGVKPGNVEREYFVRRLIRRAVRHADKLGIGEGHLADFVAPMLELYRDDYVRPPLSATDIANIIREEEVRFRKTLKDGLREFNRCTREGHLSGADAFTLFTTYGFPFELTKELTTEKNIVIDDEASFHEQMKKHQDLSRAGAAQKFAGGLADHSEKTVRLHTAHHLLLRALQIVLGPDVHQRGSNITQERLRIDFAAPRKMTDEEKKEVERIVNEKIAEKLPVIRSEMSLAEAEKLGAEHEFGQKYPERVSVYSVGPKDATEADPKFAERYSIEFCGGPHVKNTSELGKFRILKEEAVAQGIRRIKAILE